MEQSQLENWWQEDEGKKYVYIPLWECIQYEIFVTHVNAYQWVA